MTPAKYRELIGMTWSLVHYHGASIADASRLALAHHGPRALYPVDRAKLLTDIRASIRARAREETTRQTELARQRRNAKRRRRPLPPAPVIEAPPAPPGYQDTIRGHMGRVEASRRLRGAPVSYTVRIGRHHVAPVGARIVSRASAPPE
jgi:hypothetical protein